MLVVPISLQVAIGKRKYKSLIENYQNLFNKSIISLTTDRQNVKILQLQKINSLINILKENTKYYGNLSLPDQFSSLDEFSKIFPITTKEMIQGQERDFVRSDRKLGLNVVKTSTTGSTGEPLNVFRTIHDYFYTANMTRILKISGMTSESEIRFIIPKKSSIWNGQILLKIIFPKFQIWTPEKFEKILSRFSKKDQLELEKINMIFSWTRIPPSIFKRHEDHASLLRPKLLMIGGERMTDDIMNYCRKMLPDVVIHDQYATIELGWVTIMCSSGHMHVLEDSFYPEIINMDNEGLGELVCTFLYPLTMSFVRYATGDLVQEVACDCGYSGMAISVIGRTKHEELDKHFAKEILENAIDSSSTITRYFKPEKFALKKELFLEKTLFTIILPFKEEPSKDIQEKAKNEFFANLSKITKRNLYIEEGIWKFDLEFVSERSPTYKDQFIDGKIKIFNMNN